MKKQQILVISLIFILTLLFNFGSSVAYDNLYLRGKVIKKEGSILTIDVVSESCRGKKTFVIKNPKISPSPGQVIFFKINQNHCPDKKPALILKWYVLKKRR